MTFKTNWEAAGGEERTEFYRTWRTKLGMGCVSDIDQVEYTWTNGKVVPVAVIELGVADFGPFPQFLDQVLEKVAQTRGQGAINHMVANGLGVEFWVVVLKRGYTDNFWVYNLSNPKGWHKWTKLQYVAWLSRLRSDAIKKETDRCMNIAANLTG